MAYCCILPGKPWLDTAGRPIRAHGFSVFRNEAEKLWYWYGEDKEKALYYVAAALCLAARKRAGDPLRSPALLLPYYGG